MMDIKTAAKTLWDEPPWGQAIDTSRLENAYKTALIANPGKEAELDQALETLWSYSGPLPDNTPAKGGDDIIEALKDIPGIKAELCGTWVWVQGNTKPQKERLKALGLKFSKKKSRWYWKPPTDTTKRGKTMPMEYIYEKYGAKTITEEEEATC